MAETISVRFDDLTRGKLEVESAARGVGVSTFVRQLAEAELHRVRQERIRTEVQAVGEYLAEHPTAFDDDDPSEWAVMPAEVIAELMLDLVGSRIRIVYEDGRAKPVSGVLKRVAEQGHAFAVGQRIIDVSGVRSVRRLE